MKKAIFVILILLAFIIGLVVIFNIDFKKETTENKTDNIKFKEEYESLNGKKNSNNQEYVNVEIDENNSMVYATYEEIVDILEKGTGIIYFGFPECPWCRRAVPVLIDASNELGIDKIYYFNALDMRDKKSLDADGNIIIEDEGTDEYKKLVELMYDSLPVYEGLNDDTIKRLYFPTVVFVKNGEIVSFHVDTVDSHENPYESLTNEQYNELKQIYMDGMNEVYDILCDESC